MIGAVMERTGEPDMHWSAVLACGCSASGDAFYGETPSPRTDEFQCGVHGTVDLVTVSAISK